MENETGQIESGTSAATRKTDYERLKKSFDAIVARLPEDVQATLREFWSTEKPIIDPVTKQLKSAPVILSREEIAKLPPQANNAPYTRSDGVVFQFDPDFVREVPAKVLDTVM